MITLEFRDGEHDVPEHVAMLLKGIDTFTYTYDQAVRYSGQRLLKDKLNEAQRALVDDWMKRRR